MTALIADLKVVERYQLLAIEVENRGFTTKQYEKRFAQVPDKQRTLKVAEKGAADRKFMLLTKSNGGLFFLDRCWSELNNTNPPPDTAKYHCGGVRRLNNRSKKEMDEEFWEKEFNDHNDEAFDVEGLKERLEPTEEDVAKYNELLPLQKATKNERKVGEKARKPKKERKEKMEKEENDEGTESESAQGKLEDEETVRKPKNSSKNKRKRATTSLEKAETFEGEEIGESISPPKKFQKLENGDDFYIHTTKSLIEIPLIPRDCDYYCEDVPETSQGLLYLLNIEEDTVVAFREAIDLVNEELKDLKNDDEADQMEHDALSVAKRFAKKHMKSTEFRQSYLKCVKEIAESQPDEWPDRKLNNELVFALEVVCD